MLSETKGALLVNVATITFINLANMPKKLYFYYLINCKKIIISVYKRGFINSYLMQRIFDYSTCSAYFHNI